jgi:hypothetical protein
MTDRRLELQSTLETLLGTSNVYFQPPPNVVMQFPAIVYKRDNARTVFADDNPYAVHRRYLVTLITANPDDPAWEKLASLPQCLHERQFAANNLNHDVFNLYF